MYAFRISTSYSDHIKIWKLKYATSFRTGFWDGAEQPFVFFAFSFMTVYEMF